MTAAPRDSRVQELIDESRRLGVEFRFEGDRLRFRAPKGVITADLREALAARRAEVVACLRAEAESRQLVRPLGFNQQSLWFTQHLAPESVAYNLCNSARIQSPLSVDALRQAAQALVDRHAALRTTYPVVDGIPCQLVAGTATVDLHVRDAAGWSDEVLRATVNAEHQRPFDLERGPLFRVLVYTRRPDEHVLLISVHHITADGWSMMLLLNEFLTLYAEAQGGPPAQLPRLTVEYTDYTEWQQNTLAGPEGMRWAARWRELLAPPLGRLHWPSDRPRPQTPSLRGSGVLLGLGSADAAKQLAREEQTTLFVVLLAAFQVFLFRFTGSEDVIVGTPTFGRSKPEFMGVVGDFVNPVALRGRPTSGMPFRALVATLRRTVVEALEAQEYAFPLLVKDLRIERDASRSPIFDAFLTLHRFEDFRELEVLLARDESEPAVDVHGLALSSFPVLGQEGQFDLALQATEHDGVLRARFTYATDLFDESTALGFARAFEMLFAEAMREPDRMLGEFTLPEATVRAAAQRARKATIQSTEDQQTLRRARNEAGIKPPLTAPIQSDSASEPSPSAQVGDDREEILF